MPKTTKKAAEKSKVIGYLRVSTFGQELEKNKSDILALANNFDLGKVYFVKKRNGLCTDLNNSVDI